MIAQFNVYHPETREILILEGFRYSVADVAMLRDVYGIDDPELWKI